MVVMHLFLWDSALPAAASKVNKHEFSIILQNLRTIFHIEAYIVPPCLKK